MRVRARAWASIVAAFLTAGCGSDSEPSQTQLTIAKTDTDNGDGQTGPPGQPLSAPLRVVVTRDGTPASGVTVTWAAGSGGSMAPATAETDGNGISSSTWTLGTATGTQSATASVADATGSPVGFAATAVFPTGPERVVQVISASPTDANRFSPASVTVQVGTTVRWEWVDNGAAHNVVPDDGQTPASSGALTSGPHTYSFTFDDIGVFHYHCQAHGNVGGIGMSGTVTVVSASP